MRGPGILGRRFACAVPLLLVPTQALAEGGTPPAKEGGGLVASAGALLGFPVTDPNRGSLAAGGEASFMYFPQVQGGLVKPEVSADWRFGGFAQAEGLAGHARLALGAQAGKWFGAELGAALRTSDGTYAGDLGLHAGLFASAGVFGVELRATVPFARAIDASRSPLGTEVAILFSLKVPFFVDNVDILPGLFGSGRPLHDGQRPILAELVTVGAGGGPAYTDPTAVTAAIAWAHDELAEHASVPAFVRLAAELEALGASPGLAWRARYAAGQEVAHAEVCFGIASSLAGTPMFPSACPAPQPRTPSLERLAVEAFVDGCVAEHTAARLARDSAPGARSAGVARALRCIADDEAEHARLSWDVLAWALREGGAPVERALRRATPPALAKPTNSSDALIAYGRLPFPRVAAIRDVVVRQAMARRDRLLCRS